MLPATKVGLHLTERLCLFPPGAHDRPQSCPSCDAAGARTVLNRAVGGPRCERSEPAPLLSSTGP